MLTCLAAVAFGGCVAIACRFGVGNYLVLDLATIAAFFVLFGLALAGVICGLRDVLYGRPLNGWAILWLSMSVIVVGTVFGLALIDAYTRSS